MDLKEVEERVIFYEKRILTEFEKYFSYLILEDFYTGGYEDRISDEWFYEEYFEQYESGIISLLLEIEHENEEFYDFQLRLIKLKRIIDTKLLSIKSDSGNEDNIPTKRQPRISYFILNDNIDKNSFIRNLYQELIDKSFVNCDSESFDKIFNPNLENNSIEKIQWLGTELQITYFVNQLMEFLDKEIHQRKYKLIESFFLNKKGNKFNPKQLASVYTDKKEFTPNDDSIKYIMEKMSTYS